MLSWILHHTPLLYFTQSLWRDEAFSVLASQRPISFLLKKLIFEPPVYYILLHWWIRLFGTTEVAVRSLSFVAFALATAVVIGWSEKLFRKHFLFWFLPLLFFLNPMLLYYAFEVRTYAWFTLFTVLSMYTYTSGQWVKFVIAATLGFYTHSYFIFVLAVFGLHWLMSAKPLPSLVKRRWKTLGENPAFVSFVAILAAIAPWLIRIGKETARLQSSWYYPVDLHLVKSVLGNMFVGYEGTPWYMWTHTAWLSLALVVSFILALRNKKHGTVPLLFILLVFFPLTVVLGISFVKPFFVNRYLIPVTVGEVFLLGFAIETIRHKTLQKLVSGIILLALLWFNSWYPAEHPKLDIRSTIRQVNMLADKDDVILAASPLIFFESIYYSADPSRVYLYNPDGIAFPWYVGDSIVSNRQMVRDIPPYPIRAFIVYENGSYDITYETTAPTTATSANSGKP